MKTEYLLTIAFSANKVLSANELGYLQLCLMAQVEEPVKTNGDDAEYETEISRCELNLVKPA